jgi:hypothetical protein
MIHQVPFRLQVLAIQLCAAEFGYIGTLYIIICRYCRLYSDKQSIQDECNLPYQNLNIHADL